MIERKSYIGKTKDGFGAVWCDKHPEDAVIENVITFYSPDEGKIFVDKEGNMTSSIVIKDGVKIEDYTEIVKPKDEKHGNEENQND